MTSGHGRKKPPTKSAQSELAAAQLELDKASTGAAIKVAKAKIARAKEKLSSE